MNTNKYDIDASDAAVAGMPSGARVFNGRSGWFPRSNLHTENAVVVGSNIIYITSEGIFVTKADSTIPLVTQLRDALGCTVDESFKNPSVTEYKKMIICQVIGQDACVYPLPLPDPDDFLNDDEGQFVIYDSLREEKVLCKKRKENKRTIHDVTVNTDEMMTIRMKAALKEQKLDKESNDIHDDLDGGTSNNKKR